jgi:hypothetical protein
MPESNCALPCWGGERGTVAEQVLTAFRGMSVTPDDSQVNSSDRLTTVISIIKI